MVLKPAEESVNCGEYLRTVTKTIWGDGHILHPAEEKNEFKNKLKKHKHLKQLNSGNELKKTLNLDLSIKPHLYLSVTSCHLNQLPKACICSIQRVASPRG